MANLLQPSENETLAHEWRRLVCSHCGTTVDVPIYCKDRFCGLCSAPRRAKVAARISALMRQTPRLPGYRWRFITLTIPSKLSALEGLETVSNAFRRLRQRREWAAKVWGGVSVTEVTHNEHGFHVHLHLLAYSKFYPQHLLSRAFNSAGGGRICDIRLANDTGAIHYLTKYITKSSVPNEVRQELNEAFKGCRLYGTFGKAHALRIVVHDRPRVCTHCGNHDWMPLDVAMAVMRSGYNSA